MSFKIILSKISIIDLESIVEYYINLNSSTAKRYYDEIMAKIYKLKEFPEIGRFVPELFEDFDNKYRELIYENFRIIYRIENLEIKIIRIIDARRLLEINMINE